MLKKHTFLASVISIILFTLPNLAPKIELEVPQALDQKTGADGIAAYTVSAENEFQIKVSIPADSKNKKKITVAGLDQFQIVSQSTSQQMSFVNGTFSGSIHHTITMAPPEEGTFIVGPAKADGEESDRIKIIVKAPVNLPEGQNAHNAPRFVVKTDKSVAILGEPIILQLRFYPGNARVTALDFEQPQTSDFVVQQLENKEKYDDGHYIERSIKLTPLKVGKRQLGPLRMAYQFATQSHSQDPFSHVFGGLFSQQVSQKTLSAKPIVIDVQEAPATDKETSGAVGIFKNFNVSISSLSGEINEPLTLKVSVMGKGNLDELKTLKLALPASIKYYDSKNYVGAEKDEKVFEYILIPRHGGSITIPEQAFTYFDTEKRAYETLTSKPLSLTIKGTGAPAAKTPAGENYTPPSLTPDALATPSHDQEDIAFIEEDGPVTYIEKKPLSFPFFALLILLLSILVLVKGPITLHTPLRKMFLSKFSHQQFAAEFARLQNGSSPQDLYNFFKRYAAARWNISPSLITHETLSHLLKEGNFDEETRYKFLEFFERCAHASFSAHSHQETALLFKEARELLALLGQKKV